MARWSASTVSQLVAVTCAVVGPAVPAPAPAGPAPLTTAATQISPNWSGYGVSTGPFTGVGGTFTVPRFRGATCTTEMSEWVGIDGMSAPSLPPDGTLIQAGVEEFATNPSTGVCSPEGSYLSAWWEIVPGSPQPIPKMTVRAGDRVTVDIRKVRGDRWGVALVDGTDGQRFATTQLFEGRGGSAEWILEAPTNSFHCGAGVDPWAAVGVCALAPYSPSVTFSSLDVTGNATTLWPIAMVQAHEQISTPSPFFFRAFSVTYTGPLASGAD